MKVRCRIQKVRSVPGLLASIVDTYSIVLELQIANCTLPYREVYDCNILETIELNEV